MLINTVCIEDPMEIKVTKTAFQCNFFRFIDQLSFCGAGVKLQGQVMAPAPPPAKLLYRLVLTHLLEE